jgi:hypothetical protein
LNQVEKNCLDPKTKSQAYPNPRCASFSTAFLNKTLDSSTTELASFFGIGFVTDSIFKVQINSYGILQKYVTSLMYHRFVKHVPDRGSRIQLRGGLLERRDGLLHPAKDYPRIR